VFRCGFSGWNEALIFAVSASFIYWNFMSVTQYLLELYEVGAILTGTLRA